MKASQEHRIRVQQELIGAGITKYGLIKMETRHLPSIIHDDEHIGGVVYGRYEGGSGMLVATDKRLLFLDHKPFFNVTEDISYDVLSGVSHSSQGRYDGIIVHTRPADYALRFVNPDHAKRFVSFVEEKRLENGSSRTQQSTDLPKASTQSNLSTDARQFLSTHRIGVLSSMDNRGNIYGAVTFYWYTGGQMLYVLTKSNTQKSANIMANGQTAYTVFDSETQQTLQLQTAAARVDDKSLINQAIQKLLAPEYADGGIKLPPLSKMNTGEFELIQLSVLTYTYTDFRTI